MSNSHPKYNVRNTLLLHTAFFCNFAGLVKALRVFVVLTKIKNMDPSIFLTLLVVETIVKPDDNRQLSILNFGIWTFDKISPLFWYVYLHDFFPFRKSRIKI